MRPAVLISIVARAAAGVVSRSRCWPAAPEEGTSLTFTTRGALAVRR